MKDLRQARNLDPALATYPRFNSNQFDIELPREFELDQMEAGGWGGVLGEMARLRDKHTGESRVLQPRKVHFGGLDRQWGAGGLVGDLPPDSIQFSLEQTIHIESKS